MAKKASLRRAGSLKVSQVESRKLDQCDEEDAKYDEILKSRLEEKAGTTSRFFGAVTPCWGIPLNTVISFITAPSMIV
jgi:hypothetical protein